MNRDASFRPEKEWRTVKSSVRTAPSIGGTSSSLEVFETQRRLSNVIWETPNRRWTASATGVTRAHRYTIDTQLGMVLNASHRIVKSQPCVRKLLRDLHRDACFLRLAENSSFPHHRSRQPVARFLQKRPYATPSRPQAFTIATKPFRNTGSITLELPIFFSPSRKPKRQLRRKRLRAKSDTG